MGRKVPFFLAVVVGFLAAGCSDAADGRAAVDVSVGGATDPIGGPGDPDGIGECSGSYAGTYDGGDVGEFNAVIDPNGGVRVVFLSSGAGLSIEGLGAVDRSGSIEALNSSGARAVGSLDAVECRAAGEWVNEPLGVSGSWEMARTSPALTTTASRFTGCDALSGAQHREVVLIGADFSGRDLQCGDFRLAELAQPDFTDAALDGASFRGADLEEPVFSGTSLVGADLRGAVLTRASFLNADLTDANLQVIVVSEVLFLNTTCPDGTNSDEHPDSLCGLTSP